MTDPSPALAERARVLWLIRGLGPGGAEHLLVAAARAADRARFDVSVAYLMPEKDALVPELREAGVEVMCLQARRPPDLRWARRLRRRLRDHPVDIVHAHSPLAAAVSRLVARTLPRRIRPVCVSTEHNLWAAYALPTRVANALTLPLARHHFAVSEEVRAAISRPWRKRTETLVLGIDLDHTRRSAGDRTQTRAELGLADDDDVMALTVANYREKKDYPNLLNAARLVAHSPTRLRWLVVGQGPLQDRVHELHRRLELDETVTLLGYRSDVPRLTGAADLLVIGSRHEGLPVTVMEAFALGVPVVATGVGGLPGVVKEEVNGLLVPPGRPDLLAAAVERLAGDSGLRRTLSQGALRSAEQFDITRAQRRVEDVYRSLLPPPPALRPRSLDRPTIPEEATPTVLCVIKGLGPGGAERLLVHHARYASDEFSLEAAYVLPGKGHLVGELEAIGVPVSSLGEGMLGKLRWPLRLRRLMKQGRPALVHVHSPALAPVVRLLVRSLPATPRARLVYTEHNRWPLYRGITRWANRLTYGLDDATISVSDDTRRSIAVRYRTEVRVIHHGVDLDAVRSHRSDRDAARAELGISDDTILAVTVANARAEKGYPDLLAAAARVIECQDQVTFVAIGQGPDADQIAALHKRLGLGPRFRLLGYREDAVRFLAAADLFVLASHHEGLPVALMEALTLGVPVVATAVGGIPEMVDDGVEGLLVPPQRPEALAAAIERVVTDEALRRRLAEGARAKGEVFDARRATREVEAVYCEVLGQ